jgi:surface antigen
MSPGQPPRNVRNVTRTALWTSLALMLLPAMSSLAAPTPKAGMDSPAVLTVSRSSKLADLQVPAATVKLAVGNLVGGATIVNSGVKRARSSVAGVAWKSAASDGPIQLGKFAVPTLKPGQRHKAHFQIPLPKDTHAGVYTVSVCVDLLGQVQESDKKSRCHKAGTVAVGASGVKAFGPTIKPGAAGTGGGLAPILPPLAPVTPSTPGSPSTPVTPAPPNPNRGSSLTTNEALTAGQYLVSSDGHYQLAMQSDGNLVLTVSGRQLWQSDTAGNPGAWLVEQSDGNLVIYPSGDNSEALWNAGTQNNPGATAVMGTDGNLEVISSAGAKLWTSANYNPNLEQSETLTASQYVESSDGHYSLAMQSDGNLVEYVDGRPLWASNTEGHPGAWVAMQSDGDLVIYPPGNSTDALWASNTGGNPGSHLGLQVDANMVIYSAAGAAIWETSVHNPNLEQNETLTTSQYIESINGTYWAAMQSDGNFVLYGPSGAMWASSTEGHPGAWVTMQSDGNLVIYPPGNNTNALWASNTGGNPGTHLGLGTDGNLVLYNASGTAIWATNTEPHEGGGGTPRAWGQTLSYNPFAASYYGECTYWADQEFGAFTGGRYLNVRGDAYQWAGEASAGGWTVVSTPEVNSVVVFPRGVDGTNSEAGHVAWVTQVSGSKIYVSEMNASAGKGHVDEAWYTSQPGMEYILAP